MLNSKSIGNKIASARKKINLSQAALAQQISISSQAVGKWERGESMPDISTLNRLAQILGVDLNYFSEHFESTITVNAQTTATENHSDEIKIPQIKKPIWDLSKLNLIDSNFSGLKNLHEKISSANIKNCLFVDSEIVGLLLSGNNIDACNFTNSNMSHSKIQNSMLAQNNFKNCLLTESEFIKSYINACDFSNADLTNASIKAGYFTNNKIENAKLNGTKFIDMGIQDITFDGNLENCSFENCSFFGVKFKDASLINTFFKNNKKIKRVQFVNCKVDQLTYAFLKNNQANLSEVKLI